MSAVDPRAGAVPPLRLDPPPFDPAADLPEGVTFLEASAGTGKTTTIANLAVRYLAAGVPVERLLVVTFTRSATGELRERVRDRLVAAELGLRGLLAGAGMPEGDDLLALLAAGDRSQVAARHGRLGDAVADFDAATIATIHGFCEQVLTGLGTAADCGRDLRFVEDDDEVVDEVVDDLYLRKFRHRDRAAFSRGDARSVVAAAVANRDARLAPADAPAGSVEALRANLARVGRDEVIRRARVAGTIGWDDQITRLAATLHGPSADVAIRRLQARYAVVLVDEFQDTDQVQWDVFRTAFAGSGAPLLLIGDPKQAIYSFRGADVWTYLEAAATASARYTLGTNWRSDQPLLDAVDALLAGATLGHPEIPYRRVTAASGHVGARLTGAQHGAALRLRLVHRGDGRVERTERGWAQVDSARAIVAADLADDLAGLLASGAVIHPEAPGPAAVPAGPGAPVTPGDVAVLVRANHEAQSIHRALDAVGVPAVIAGGGSVFGAPAAAHWLSLLEALEQPAASARARSAALTPFVGWDAATLVAAADAELDVLQATLHRWAAVLAGSGVAALTETIAVEGRLVARELAFPGGERRLTDLRHVAELLHAEALASGAGGRALTGWLRDRIGDAGNDNSAEERSRRLDSDAAAVQIQTIHRAKGLEYPIVYLPSLWSAFPSRDSLPVFHDPDAGDQRTIDVGGQRDEGFERHRDRAAEERRGEDLRQAYVALTRARHQVVAWWATGSETKNAPLARFLLGRHADGSMPSRPAPVPRNDDEVEARMVGLASRVPGHISVERVGPPSGRRWQPGAPDAAPLDVATFERTLDTAWRRSSYTAITAAAHAGRGAPAVASEGGDHVADDEPAAPEGAGGAGVPGALASGAGALASGAPASPDGGAGTGARPALVSPMGALPAGAAFGIAVHSVLEAVDFAAADLPAAVLAAARTVPDATGDGSGALDPDALATALVEVLDTPLGLAGDAVTLRGVGRADRLDELRFELPLLGGDRPAGTLAPADLAGCLRRHLPPTDPLAAYPDRLEDPGLAQALRGYLVGSIDLVLRVPSKPGPRFVVVDYKTNWLGPPGEELTTWHYRPARMAEAMAAEHYPLQGVLYAVALHRYLRWRMAGYDPSLHLGGVAYLFLRGMAGPATPVVDGGRCGVFPWQPPPAMIVELSDLLDSGGGR